MCLDTHVAMYRYKVMLTGQKNEWFGADFCQLKEKFSHCCSPCDFGSKLCTAPYRSAIVEGPDSCHRSSFTLDTGLNVMSISMLHQ